MSDEYTTGVRIGASCNQAAEVLSGSWRLLAEGKLTAEQLIGIHLELAEGFHKNAETIHAAQGIATAFPGTQAVAQPAAFPQQAAAPAPAPVQPQGGFTPANVVQGQFGQQQPAAAPQAFQPAPGAQPAGASKTDQDWMALFNNPSGFWDNRQSKKTPDSPDFRQKNNGPISLWLNGKYGPAPQWVLDRLQGGYGPVQ
jgi:hypothetical protein